MPRPTPMPLLTLVAAICLAGPTLAQDRPDRPDDRPDPRPEPTMSVERMIDQIRGSDLPEPTKRRLEIMLERRPQRRADRDGDRPLPPLARPRDRGPEMRGDRPRDRAPEARADRPRDREWDARRPGPVMDRPRAADRGDRSPPRFDRDALQQMRERRQAWRDRFDDDRWPRLHDRRRPGLRRDHRPDHPRFDRPQRLDRGPRFDRPDGFRRGPRIDRPRLDRGPRFEGRDPVELRRGRDPVDRRLDRGPTGQRRLDRLERDLEALSRQLDRMRRDFAPRR